MEGHGNLLKDVHPCHNCSKRRMESREAGGQWFGGLDLQGAAESRLEDGPSPCFDSEVVPERQSHIRGLDDPDRLADARIECHKGLHGRSRADGVSLVP